MAQGRAAVSAMYVLPARFALHEFAARRAHRDMHAMAAHVIAQSMGSDTGRIALGLKSTNLRLV
jgi:hypothetical protein